MPCSAIRVIGKKVSFNWSNLNVWQKLKSDILYCFGIYLFNQNYIEYYSNVSSHNADKLIKLVSKSIIKWIIK